MCAFIDEVVLPNDRIFMYMHIILCVYVFFVFVHYVHSTETCATQATQAKYTAGNEARSRSRIV